MKNGKPLPEIPGPPISYFNYRSRDEKFMRTHWCFMTSRYRRAADRVSSLLRRVLIGARNSLRVDKCGEQPVACNLLRVDRCTTMSREAQARLNSYYFK